MKGPHLQPQKIGGYAITQTPDGVKFVLTGETIACVVLYRFLLFSLSLILVKSFLGLPKLDVLMFAVVLLCVVPVTYLIFAPIRLGFEISRNEVIINRFIVCFTHRRRIPLGSIQYFADDTYKGSRSMVTAITFSFYAASEKITAARLYAFSKDTIREHIANFKGIVEILLKDHGAPLASEEPPGKDYTWHVAAGLLGFCLVSYILRVYGPVFANTNQGWRDGEYLLYKVHFWVWIALVGLAVVSLIKVNRRQIIGTIIFALCGFLTYEKLLVPTRMAIVDWALSDTEAVTAKVVRHGKNTVGNTVNLPRAFFFEFDYKGKRYADFFPLSEEDFRREKKRMFRVGANIKLDVSRRFPTINRLSSDAASE